MPSLKKTALSALTRLSGRILSSMSQSERESVARALSSDRAQPDVAAYNAFSKAFVEGYEGITNTLWTNGEKWLLERLAPFDLKTIFDVGANHGQWTQLAYDAHPSARIHSFEIVPGTFAMMKDNLAGMADRTILNSIGLSNREGMAKVHIDPSSDVLSTTLDFASDSAAALDTIQCPVITGARYCAEHGIERIDFLKIDVEGAEINVLRGFESLIDRQTIRIIQFEYNRGAIVSGFLLRDFFQYFTQRGYTLGKLYPNGVRFHDYSFIDEDFRGPNYVAVLGTEGAVIEAVGL